VGDDLKNKLKKQKGLGAWLTCLARLGPKLNPQSCTQSVNQVNVKYEHHMVAPFLPSGLTSALEKSPCVHMHAHTCSRMCVCACGMCLHLSHASSRSA
jgi:hypothetical protein